MKFISTNVFTHDLGVGKVVRRPILFFAMVISPLFTGMQGMSGSISVFLCGDDVLIFFRGQLLKAVRHMLSAECQLDSFGEHTGLTVV